MKPAQRRVIAEQAENEFGISERRSCRLLLLNRATKRYRHRRDQKQDLRIRIRDIAYTHISYGYRRITKKLKMEGWDVGKTCVQNIYRSEGLSLRRRKPKRRVQCVKRVGRQEVDQPHHSWAMDFIHDRLVSGRAIRTLAIIDIFSRQCLALVPLVRFTAQDVVRVLSQAIRNHAKPTFIRCDNGTEFTGIDVDLWAYQEKVKLDFSRPGKPTDNAYIESFNARFRAEFLSQHWFDSVDSAKKLMQKWMYYYNYERPHSALGDVPPANYISQLTNRKLPTCLTAFSH